MTEELETGLGCENTKTGNGSVCMIVPPAVFLLCLAVGTYFSSRGGAIVTLQNPFAGETPFLWMAATLCFWDIFQIFLLGCTAENQLFLPASCLIFSVRGLALGAAICFCTTNALPVAAVGMTASYGMVSVLMTVYVLLLRRLGKEAGLLYKMLCYFAVSGGAALLRLLPYLLLQS